MATYEETVIRVIQNVIQVKKPSLIPVSPDELFVRVPRLGFSAAKVRGLAGSLQTEFSAENLILSNAELGRLAPPSPREMGRVVFNRIREISKKGDIQLRVFSSIKILLGPTTTVTTSTNIGAGGLGLSTNGDFRNFAKEFNNAFFPLVRMKLDGSDLSAPGMVRVSDWITLIVGQFTNQNRIVNP